MKNTQLHFATNAQSRQGFDVGRKRCPPETLRPVETRYERKVESGNEFCTYGAIVGMMDLVFYPHLMPKGIGEVSG
jgi:hypothetical protein